MIKKDSPGQSKEAAAQTQGGLTVIFKGLNLCNAGCTFCCVGEMDGKVISWSDFCLAIDKLEIMLAEASIRKLTFTFHGGEPTMLGADLLERMCRRVSALPVEVQYNMQSNLIALPSDVKKVIDRHKIKLGTSVDPLCLDRLNKMGKTAFFKWLDNFFRLVDEGFTPGAIYVVTRNSLHREDQILSICEAVGALAGDRFPLQINPVYPQGLAGEADSGITVTPEEFGEFLVEIWRRWESGGRAISLGPVQQFADHFATKGEGRSGHFSCSFGADCSASHLGIDYDLNVAQCGRRLDSKAFIGNLKQESLLEIINNSSELQKTAERTELLRMGWCNDCRFFSLCHGGCPDDASLVCGTILEPHPWCTSYLKLFETMEKEIDMVRCSASPPPRRPAHEKDKLQIQLVQGDRWIGEAVQEKAEVWMLPDPTGRRFAFDSPFSHPTHEGKPLNTKIWCHNRHAKALVMWEDLLQDPKIAVVLFELEGLEQAMNVLNSVKATIILDVIRITDQEEGMAGLRNVIDRFTSDPLWNSQVFPFTQLVSNAISGAPARFRNQFGLAPGTYLASIPSGEMDALEQRIVSELETDADPDPAAWVASRRGCLQCNYLRICGARFARGDGKECRDELRAEVGRLAEVAAGLREIMPARNT